MAQKGEFSGSFVPCENCGKVVYKTPYQMKIKKRHFCSNKCQFEKQHSERFEMRKCEVCGKEFECSKLSSKRFCSMRCQSEWQKTRTGEDNPKYKHVNCVCDYCGKTFMVAPYKTELDQKHFCGTECRQKWYAEVFSQQKEWKEASKIRAAKILSDGKIPSTNSKPQIIINGLLDGMGILYRNEKNFKYYSVDNYLIDSNLIIEVMGDFWHCSPIKFPDVNKLRSAVKPNIGKDKAKHTYLLKYYGIEVLYLWEQDIYDRIDVCQELILEYIKTEGILKNYHSFNYSVINGTLKLNDNIITPYFEQVS